MIVFGALSSLTGSRHASSGSGGCATMISRTLVLNIAAVCSEAFASFSSSTHGQTSATKLSIGFSVSILSRTTYHRSLFVSYLCLAPIARADSAALASLLSVTTYVSPPDSVGMENALIAFPVAESSSRMFRTVADMSSRAALERL